MLVAVPYAMKAGNADMLGGFRAEDFLRRDSSVNYATSSPNSSLMSGESATLASVEGTGTPNYLTRWASDGATLVDSRLFQNGSGYIGLGVANPTHIFHVGDRSRFGDLLIGENQGSADPAKKLGSIENLGTRGLALLGSGMNNFPAYPEPPIVDWTAELTPGIVIRDTGNVGVGTREPATRLDVKQYSSSYNSGLRLTDPARSRGVYFWLDGAANARISNGGGGDGTVSLNGDGSGNVGIGTLTPQARLDVAGDARMTNLTATGTATIAGVLTVNNSTTVAGNINAKYQDVAEWVDAAEPLPPATVVAAHPTRANHVRKSTKAYVRPKQSWQVCRSGRSRD